MYLCFACLVGCCSLFVLIIVLFYNLYTQLFVQLEMLLLMIEDA